MYPIWMEIPSDDENCVNVPIYMDLTVDVLSDMLQ